MLRLPRIALSAAAVAAVALLTSQAPAGAHGDLDQHLQFDPGCLTTSLRATATTSVPRQQEFVPTGSGLQSLDVCLTLASPANVTVNIRSGTVASPGPVLTSASATGVPTGTRWVHFELAALQPTTPGSPYIIEVTGFPQFSWRGTCATVGGACTSVDPDLYPAGVSNGGPSVGDFAFRTFSSVDSDGDAIADPADNCPSVANPGQENNDRNLIDQTPPMAFDDATWINSDNNGDACDADDDNDGLDDAHEAEAGPGGASHALCSAATADTNPMARDSDRDRFLDGAECALGTDPMDANSRPPAIPAGDSDSDGLTDAFEAALGTNPNAPDSDGDALRDGIEYRNYGSNPLSANTDGDACADLKEAASVDGNATVGANDLGLIASGFGNYGLIIDPGEEWRWNMDVDKNGAVGASDLGLAAAAFGSC